MSHPGGATPCCAEAAQWDAATGTPCCTEAASAAAVAASHLRSPRPGGDVGLVEPRGKWRRTTRAADDARERRAPPRGRNSPGFRCRERSLALSESAQAHSVSGALEGFFAASFFAKILYVEELDMAPRGAPRPRRLIAPLGARPRPSPHALGEASPIAPRPSPHRPSPQVTPQLDKARMCCRRKAPGARGGVVRDGSC